MSIQFFNVACVIVGMTLAFACGDRDQVDPPLGEPGTDVQGGGGSGSGGGGSVGEGGAMCPNVGCQTANDCTDKDPWLYSGCGGSLFCLKDEYGIGHCQYVFPPKTINPLQDVAGDCSLYICDDADTVIAYDPSDPEDDHNDCTVDWCIEHHKTGHSYSAGSMTTQGKPCVGPMGPGVCDLGACVP